MNEIRVVGIDLGKDVFHLICMDEEGTRVAERWRSIRFTEFETHQIEASARSSTPNTRPSILPHPPLDRLAPSPEFPAVLGLDRQKGEQFLLNRTRVQSYSGSIDSHV